MIFGSREKLKSNSTFCVVSCIDGTPLHKVDHIKYLGVWLDSELSFKSHINHVNIGIGTLYRSQKCFTYSVRKKLASQLILPFIDYCDVVYQTASKSDLAPLNIACNRVCRFVLDCYFFTHHCIMYDALYDDHCMLEDIFIGFNLYLNIFISIIPVTCNDILYLV